MLGDVPLALHSFVLHRLSGIDGKTPQLRDMIDHVHHQTEPVEIVHHRHVERRGGGTFLLIPAHMQILVIRPAIGQAMNQPRVAMKGEMIGLSVVNRLSNSLSLKP